MVNVVATAASVCIIGGLNHWWIVISFRHFRQCYLARKSSFAESQQTTRNGMEWNETDGIYLLHSQAIHVIQTAKNQSNHLKKYLRMSIVHSLSEFKETLQGPHMQNYCINKNQNGYLSRCVIRLVTITVRLL